MTTKPPNHSQQKKCWPAKEHRRRDRISPTNAEDNRGHASESSDFGKKEQIRKRFPRPTRVVRNSFNAFDTRTANGLSTAPALHPSAQTQSL
jgi:hypothetical protein